jgi:hypothetical protein
MTDWTKEEDEAFNEVEKQSNLSKQILRSQGQPYHWEIEAIQAAIRIEREACAKVCEDLDAWNMDDPASTAAKAIRARGQA